MQRILIIGPCGAGKSTLAFRLGEKLNLPVFHMDKLNWRSGWVESSKDDIRARLDAIIAGERWLIDGNYSGTLEPRLSRADAVIYLDFPVRLCMRLFKRLWTWRGRTRPDMTEGCPERFSLELLIYLLRWNGGPRVHTEHLLKCHEGKTIRFNGPDELEQWVSEKVK